MAVLPVYNCFHPVLKEETQPIDNFDDDLKKFVEDMFETMYVANGIGLAGNQVGEKKSVVTIDLGKRDGKQIYPPFHMINPEIVETSDDEIVFQEGCLSIPKFFDDVVRPEFIKVKYWDVDEKEHVIEADALLARVIQHEVDHLQGYLFTDRMSPIRRTLAKNKLKQIKRGKVQTDYPMILPDGSLAK